MRTSPPAAPSAARPLRRDAARNRARILTAAGELFAVRGLGTTLNDIARHAGVGVATVYRHFPDRDELIETLFQERIDALVQIGEAGLADPDPWRGLTVSMERALELQAVDRGLRELVNDSPEGLARVGRVRERMLPIAAELVRRAQSAGTMRADVDPGDVPLVQLMTGAVIDAARDVDPELWRRYLGLLIRGLAAHPEQTSELPGRALAPADVDRVMTTYKTARRG